MKNWIFKRICVPFIAAVAIESLALFIAIVPIESDAFGQVNYSTSSEVTPVSYHSMQNSAWSSTTQTASYAPESGNLAERVAELEATLKAMKKKEAAAKKKAAGKPTVKLGGRFQWDCAGFDQDATSIAQGQQRDGCEFRRLWLHAKGDMFDVCDYKVQLGFESSDTVSFKDVYMTIRELPYVGHIRVGHFKEPFSLEQLTGSNDINFMERSTSDNAFVPARNSGIMCFDTLLDERVTWAFGGFVSKNSSSPPTFHTDTSGGLAMTGRVTSLLWYDEAAPDRGLLHIGAAYSYRDMDDNEARFRARPEAHLATYVVDTGTITNVADVQLVNFEAAYTWGPVFAQAECFGAQVDRKSTGISPYYTGCYGTIGWFLTGENRKYKKGNGVFSSVKPNENFFRVRAQDGNVYTGMGAWELLYRYSYLDLDSQDINGGLVSDHTIGVNWYLNPYMRVMFNYVNSTVTDTHGEGNMNIFETRAQVRF